MLHIVHLIEPRHAGRIVALLVALSACGALAGALVLSSRH